MSEIEAMWRPATQPERIEALAELEREIQGLSDQIREVKRRREELLRSWVPFTEGDLVRPQRGALRDQVVRVANIETSVSGGVFRIGVNVKKQDGEWGKAVRVVYDPVVPVGPKGSGDGEAPSDG